MRYLLFCGLSHTGNPILVRRLISEESALARIFDVFLKQCEKWVCTDKDTQGEIFYFYLFCIFVSVSFRFQLLTIFPDFIQAVIFLGRGFVQ